MEVVAAVVQGFMGCFNTISGEEVGHFCQYRRNIRNLEEQTENLRHKRDRMQQKINAAKDNLENIHEDVMTWINRADGIVSESQNLLEADPRCINLWGRYRFGKKAYLKANEVKDLLNRDFETISYLAPLEEIKSSYSKKNLTAFKSRKSMMEKIKEALDDEMISIIGICGMAGVGKTTIVEEVREQAESQNKFNKVVMVTVSQTPNLIKIQDEIAKEIGLKPESRDKSEKKKALWKKIKMLNQVLIILDDMWERIDLVHQLGIPCGKDHNGCKVLFTTRHSHVCHQMEAQETVAIEALDRKEAWMLFKEIAGESVESTSLHEVARKVANECCGLPLAIVTVAGALKGRTEDVWVGAANHLKKSTPTSINERVFSSLGLSYKLLASEEKELLLLCSMFPEDYNIRVEHLVMYAAGLRLFRDASGIQDVREETNCFLSNLKSSFLLMEGRFRDSVKMHDVVRDFAISRKQENPYMLKAGIGLRDWPDNDATPRVEEYAGISLMGNKIEELPDGLECPRLQILLLQENFDLEVPNNFFQGMKDLKVLDMSRTDVLMRPPTVSVLASLKTLVLQYCSLRDISIVGTLKQLEILSLFGSNLLQIPESFSRLTNLRLFDLNDCQCLRRIPAGVIQSLHKLEELYALSFHLEWAAKEEGESTKSNASLDELKCLTRLNNLKIFVPEHGIFPEDLVLQRLNRFEIVIANKTPRLKLVQMFGFDLSLSLKEARVLFIFDVPKLFSNLKALIRKTQRLGLQSCKFAKDVLNDPENEGLRELCSLILRDCPQVKYLLSTNDCPPRTAFCNLVKLKLENQHDLIQICDGELPTESFGQVQKLKLYHCNSMSIVIPSNLLIRMQNLRSLDAQDCGLLRNVFDIGELETEGLGANKLLSELGHLRCGGLPELIHIWKGPHHLVSLSNLKTIDLSCCPKLRQLFSNQLVQDLVDLSWLFVSDCGDMEEVFGKNEEAQVEIVEALGRSPRTLPCLQNLTQVELEKCGKLRNIFSPSIAKGLIKLRILSVESCSAMESIIEWERGGGGAGESIEKIEFRCLEIVRLIKLDMLTCFWMGHYVVEFPSLQEVTISECPRMETFGYGDQTTPKLKKVKVTESLVKVTESSMLKDLPLIQVEETWKGDLNATVHHIYLQHKVYAPPEQVAQASSS